MRGKAEGGEVFSATTLKSTTGGAMAGRRGRVGTVKKDLNKRKKNMNSFK